MSNTTPPPAATARFAVVRKGFDREQVDATLQRLEAEVEVLRADRDAAVDRADRAAAEAAAQRNRTSDLESRVAELGRAPVTTGQMSDRVSTMLSLATAEAESIRDTANAGAAQTRADADEDAWNLREAARQAAEADRSSAAAELEAVRRRAVDIRTEHTNVLESARTRAREIILAAERDRDRLDAEAAQARAQIDDDHRIASDARRLEARTAADRRREESETAARATVDDATHEAERIMGLARGHVDELRTARERVLDELAALRARLETIPGPSDGIDLEIPDPPEVSSNGG